MKRSGSRRILAVAEPLAVLLTPVFLVLATLANWDSVALLSSVMLSAALVPFVLSFELARPRPRDLMPVVVLAALAVAGRLLFEALPNFQPVTALLILTGLYFGRRSGFLAGMLAALVSNMFLVQGLWTPWQMYAWGVVAYLAGLFFAGSSGALLFVSGRPAIHEWLIYLYGVVASLVFGVFMDLQYFISFARQSGLAGLGVTLLAGLPFNLAHAASTLIFLALTLRPWGRKIQRLKTKYNLRIL
jgi:energy-coupling factor transport system substrate-specific component